MSTRNPPTKKPERTLLIGQREIRGFLIGQRQTNQGESCIRAAGQIFSPLFAAVKIIYRHCRQYWHDCSMRTNRLERLERLLGRRYCGLKLFFVMQIRNIVFGWMQIFTLSRPAWRLRYIIALNSIMVRLWSGINPCLLCTENPGEDLQ